ncbi:questin oxidase family protein [Streptomyces sp. NPDC049577]|uniref:questin oxidase family protein n=1 Tax=Streptomyces sp. NPDC049577 TaxID=3155153 RepID=UPI00342F291F
MAQDIDPSGTLDEALQRVHRAGPEFQGWLTNHAPMAVEALVRRGRTSGVHPWLDVYRRRLEELPGTSPTTRVTGANWREALGDPARLGDWIAYFADEVAERPWRDVLVTWWPRLLPGICGGSTHPVIRVGHAVRTLLAGRETAPRTAELAHALGYWAARHQPLAVPVSLARTGRGDAPEPALAAVPALADPDEEGGIRARFARLPRVPGWPADASTLRPPAGPEDARELLAELVRAATRRYPDYAHGDAVMLVHTATAPNGVLRTLPALPRELWAPSLAAAWEASAAVTAAYVPAEPLPPVTGAPASAEDAFERAAAHGDEHVIKLADTALDVGGPAACAAVARACELIEPLT